MSATILSGTEVAAALKAELKQRVEALSLEYIFPVLATIRVGESGEAVSYERGILKAAEATGVRVRRYILPADTAQKDLLQLIDEINVDPLLSGLLLLKPLPAQLDVATLCNRIRPEKDVDSVNLVDKATFWPCTAEACIQILRYYEIPIVGMHAVVLGRSRTAGLPTAKLLLDENATVTVCHSKTPETVFFARQADILIAAVGKPTFVTRAHIKPGAVVLDVGIHRDPDTGKLCGDVYYNEAVRVAGALTPVPGGVGAVTSTILMRHVIDAAERNAK